MGKVHIFNAAIEESHELSSNFDCHSALPCIKDPNECFELFAATFWSYSNMTPFYST